MPKKDKAKNSLDGYVSMRQLGDDAPLTVRNSVTDEKLDTRSRLERDDTGYISPYRRRLQARAAAGNRADSGFYGAAVGNPNGSIFPAQRPQIEARAQLTAIHAASKKKDGGRRGR